MQRLLKKIAEKMTKLEKVLLYLMYAKNSEPINGKTMLQKEMFLIANYSEKIKEEANFIPHNHGAYSEAVELTMDRLKSYELINEKGYKIFISSNGKEVISLIEKEFDEEEKNFIIDFKEFMNPMTYMESLVYSYYSFPDFVTDSVIIDNVKKNRLKSSISMYKKGLINLEKASFLAGIESREFLKKV